MEALIFLYLLVFPFGQLGRFEIGPGVAVHFVDVLVFFIALAWGLRWLGKRVKIAPLWRPFVSFAAIASFSLAFAAARHPPAEVFVGSLYLLRFVAYALFYFAVWDFVKAAKQYRRTLFDALLVVGSIVSIFGLLQYFSFPDTRGLLAWDWDEHYFRLIGTFLDPAFTGIILVFFMLLLFARLWGRKEWGKAFILFLLGFSALLLTYSRASFLALAAGLAAVYIVRRNLKIVLGGMTLLALGAFLLPRPGGEGVNLSRTSTIVSRLASYQTALTVGSEQPLFGTGFNLYRFARGADPRAHSGAGTDSSLLFVFTTTGIPGLLAYLWLLTGILSLAWKNRKSEQGLALFASFVAVFVHSFFSNTLFYPWVLGWIGVLAAIQEN